MKTELQWMEIVPDRLQAASQGFGYSVFQLCAGAWQVEVKWDMEGTRQIASATRASKMLAIESCQSHASAISSAIEAEVRLFREALVAMVNDKGILWIHGRPFLSKNRAQELLQR